MDRRNIFYKLVEQIERATRELENDSYGPEHDQVRRCYTSLIVGGTSSPMAKEQARRAVLFDLLYQALPICVEEFQYLPFSKGVLVNLPYLENSQETDELCAQSSWYSSH